MKPMLAVTGFSIIQYAKVNKNKKKNTVQNDGICIKVVHGLHQIPPLQGALRKTWILVSALWNKNSLFWGGLFLFCFVFCLLHRSHKVRSEYIYHIKKNRLYFILWHEKFTRLKKATEGLDTSISKTPFASILKIIFLLPSKDRKYSVYMTILQWGL